MISWCGKIPRRRNWQPTLVFLTAEFHGQGSLVGWSMGITKLDMTEHVDNSKSGKEFEQSSAKMTVKHQSETHPENPEIWTMVQSMLGDIDLGIVS